MRHVQAVLSALAGSGLLVLFALLVPADLSGAAQTANNHITVPDREIRRLPPESFPALPPAVAAELRRRGCLVPQTWMADRIGEPHNVISGEFERPGQTDWAVLCSIKGTSSLLVFWDGRAADVEQVPGGTVPDEVYLQGVGGGRFGFGRLIQAVGRDVILRYLADNTGEESSPIDHQGINDAFLEKGSTVHYRSGGQWLRLPGAD